MIKLVILDFDGTIVKSENIKLEAFLEMFKEYKQHAEISRYLKANHGLFRAIKFKHIYENILGKPIDAETINQLSNVFSELVVQKVVACPFVEGAQEFLEKWHNKKPIILISATPHQELEMIVEKRGLTKFFAEIHGAPARKSDMILDAVAKHKVLRSETVYIGDAKEDFENAQRAGIEFIALTRSGFSPSQVKKIKNLFELDTLLEEIA